MFLARFTDLTADGLFTVVGGGVNRINAGEFPWSWGLLFLLARIRLSTEEAQAVHRYAIERETPDGFLESIASETPLERMPPTAEIGPDGNVGLNLSLCLVNLVFPKAGVYKYRLRIDGEELGVAELLVAGLTQGEQGR
jgi:hypothetical protein